MQRDRQWSSYEDVEARYERRPSAWCAPAPLGPRPWELVQLPTPDETHDNVVCLLGAAAVTRPGTPLEVSYELAWQGDGNNAPSAWATQSRKAWATQAKRRSAAHAGAVRGRFRPGIARPEGRRAPVKAVVTSDANGRVLESGVYPTQPPASGA